MKKAIQRAFAVSLLSAAVAWGAGAQAADVIKIGVAGPMTGDNAAFGEQFWRGAVQAAEDINAAGGVNGKKIELVVYDDGGDANKARTFATRLIEDDKVDILVGGTTTFAVKLSIEEAHEREEGKHPTGDESTEAAGIRLIHADLA